jgi:thiosulfate/3-mercaptopyruvate sulfurtransferase
MINYEYMTKRWEDNGILPSNDNSFYCGTGWRAAETWFYSKSLGWEKTSLYDGGWKEWSETPGNPTATGDYK